jgi:hypothetical protein
LPVAIFGFFLGSLFDLEDEGSMFLQNVSEHLPDYMALHIQVIVVFIGSVCHGIFPVVYFTDSLSPMIDAVIFI